MKDQARLRRLIRKIVREEIEKFKQEHLEPIHPQELEEPEWGMFDEIDFESPHTNELLPESKKRYSRALPGWSEPHSETVNIKAPPQRVKKKKNR